MIWRFIGQNILLHLILGLETHHQNGNIYHHTIDDSLMQKDINQVRRIDYDDEAHIRAEQFTDLLEHSTAHYISFRDRRPPSNAAFMQVEQHDYVYSDPRRKKPKLLLGFPKIVLVIVADVLALTLFMICIPLVLGCAKRRRPLFRSN